MVSLALTSYDEFLKEHTLSTDVIKTKMVKEVGANIANAVSIFMKEKNWQ